MSRLIRFMRRGAIVGAVAAAASVTVASAATPTARAAGPAATAAGSRPSDVPLPSPVGDLVGDGGDTVCLLFAYNLGPFGPLGPWGPYGPLKDKPHPACVGGGPDFKK